MLTAAKACVCDGENRVLSVQTWRHSNTTDWSRPNWIIQFCCSTGCESLCHYPGL